MEHTKFFLLVILIFAAGCAQKLSSEAAPPEKYQSCKSDADCMPQPGCHAMNCINSDYANRFEQPEACTMMYACKAAYSQEDCLCKDNLCVNRKSIEGDPACDE